MQYLVESSSSSPPPEEIFVEHGGIMVRMTEAHSLWAHKLWSASRVLTDLIINKTIDVKNQKILELGSGCGLVSIAASRMQAEVVTTDYPDAPIINNLKYNFDINKTDAAEVCGYVWGNQQDFVFEKFDQIMIADCIQMTNEHDNILKTIGRFLKDDGVCQLTFCHHQPYKRAKVENFIDLAKQQFQVQKMDEIWCPRVCPEDDEIFDIKERETVFWYQIRK